MMERQVIDVWRTDSANNEQSCVGTVFERAEREGLGADEAELVALISQLRLEQTPEADFEERFVCDLRDRIVRDAACCPARFRLFEHLCLFFRRHLLSSGASALGVGALAVGCFSVWPSEERTPARTAASSSVMTSGYEESLAGLAPSSVSEVEQCTSIRVGPSASLLYGDDPVMALGDFPLLLDNGVFASSGKPFSGGGSLLNRSDSTLLPRPVPASLPSI